MNGGAPKATTVKEGQITREMSAKLTKIARNSTLDITIASVPNLGFRIAGKFAVNFLLRINDIKRNLFNDHVLLVNFSNLSFD